MYSDSAYAELSGVYITGHFYCTLAVVMISQIPHIRISFSIQPTTEKVNCRSTDLIWDKAFLLFVPHTLVHFPRFISALCLDLMPMDPFCSYFLLFL